TNNGPAASPNTTVTENLPTNTTFVSASGPGWTCNLITTSTPNTITCSLAAALASGANATISVVVTVAAGTSNGTVISDTASVVSGVEDPNTGNNNATANVTVAAATQADLSVTSSASPSNVVTNSNNITYTQVVQNNGPAASGTATFTDTIPTGTSFVSFGVPTGWNCGTLPAVGATTGTITCTISSLAVNATASFPFVVKVTVGTAAGTGITNTANINIPCSSTTDPNCANNTASTTVYVASATQSDLAIVKTASPEPVNQGTNLAYTLQVTNNGPAVAQNVVVTDPLPSQVTYSSASTTQGSCSQASGTVTCNLGSVSVGGLVLITINVSANTFSSATLASNTATVTASTSDPNLTNNTSTAISTIQSPTAVQIASFQAFAQPGGGVLVEWQTREETRNLGFHVYREDAHGRHRLDASLIAGSALFLRGGQPQHRAKSYQWVDPDGTPQASYFLEDVDLNGTRTLHGPIYVGSTADSVAASAAPVSQARLLTDMNQTIALAPAQVSHPLATPAPLIPEVAPGVTPISLNDVPAVKISVTS